MNKHLRLVRDFHEHFGIKQPNYLETTHLSDMDIVMYQALLMDSGSTTFKAITSGDIANILAGLVDLAYTSLMPIACRGEDVITLASDRRQNGSVLSVAQILCDKICLCTTGETIRYSAIYNVCEQLIRGFINADFDKAFQIVHWHLMLQPTLSTADHDYAARIIRSRLPVPPDLSETLYE